MIFALKPVSDNQCLDNLSSLYQLIVFFHSYLTLLVLGLMSDFSIIIIIPVPFFYLLGDFESYLNILFWQAITLFGLVCTFLPTIVTYISKKSLIFRAFFFSFILFSFLSFFLNYRFYVFYLSESD